MATVQQKSQAPGQTGPETEEFADPEIIRDETLLQKRNRILSEKSIAYETTRKAWFTLSHLLLDDGARVVDMGCGDGAVTFTMAALNPQVHFTGLDKNRRLINQANAKYDLPNLEFKVGDASSALFPDESVDAIINTHILHALYSNSRYNDEIVTDTLRTQFKILKKDGIMFIRDFIRPAQEEFVLIEIPDEKSTGEDLSSLSEADLLVWYSLHARPRQDAGCSGFFLEELPPRIPGKRLFRLPHKWAYEFALRKDDREHWESELPTEYTFFTPREFRQALRKLGARVQYSGPHWDDDHISKHFEGRFRLFNDDGAPLGYPPTSFIAVAVKMDERRSLSIEERRPSQTDETSLIITGVRNQKTGDIVDIVSRNNKISEIIPYRVDEEGRLKIYLHDGVTRSVAGAVPRSGINIDDRQWSGHMVEPIAVDADILANQEEFTAADAVRFGRDYLGLKPQINEKIEKGPDYYPSPDYIDERISTFYLKVSQAGKALVPKPAADHAGKFLAKGKIRELDAQHVLNAIAVGLIPSAQLELQILALFERLKLKSENWNMKEFQIKRGEISGNLKARDLLNQLGNNIKRFQDIKGSAGQLRPIHSIFVEEGMSAGSATGLSAQDMDFVIHNDKTINTAVVLPITRGMQNDLHAGFQLQHMPIPQRFGGSSTTVAAPSFNLPPEITDIRQARQFIADKFGVLPEMVIKLGESYYSHLGITPQRIHPFAVAAPPDAFRDTETNFLPFYQLMMMQPKLGTSSHFMITIARAFRMLHHEIRQDFDKRVGAIVKERFNDTRPDWSLPLSYEPAPLGTPAVKAPEAEVKIQAAPPVSQPAPEAKPEALPEDIVQEMEEFIDTLAQSRDSGPKLEKW